MNQSYNFLNVMNNLISNKVMQCLYPNLVVILFHGVYMFINLVHVKHSYIKLIYLRKVKIKASSQKVKRSYLYKPI